MLVCIYVCVPIYVQVQSAVAAVSLDNSCAARNIVRIPAFYFATGE